MAMSLVPSQEQSLQMRLSPQMLQSLSVMALPSADLRDLIYEEAERNPALEIIRDSEVDRDITVSVRPHSSDAVRLTGSGDPSAESDAYQSFIESRGRSSETLQEHLLGQLSLLSLDEKRRSLCGRIIQNLDRRGFHYTAPAGLLLPGENTGLLKDCLRIVQHMDPHGVGCSNVEESLFLQAKLAGTAPALALYILNGHLDILENIRPQAVLKKLKTVLKDENNKSGLAGCTESDVKEAVAYIRTLNPHPAGQYGSGNGNSCVVPDVKLVRTPVPDDEQEAENESYWNDGSPRMPVMSGGNGLRYRLTALPVRDALPQIALSDNFEQVLRRKKTDAPGPAAQLQFVKDSVSGAKIFIRAVEQRERSILTIAQAIADRQTAFFEKGSGALAPLKLKDVAAMVGLHEGTVSRAVNGKYMQSPMGIAELRSFFSSGVTAISGGGETGARPSGSSGKGAVFSREAVKDMLRRIIAEYESDSENQDKPLSDSALAGLLEARGVRLARRTVAKYRSELNIDSSFRR